MARVANVIHMTLNEQEIVVDVAADLRVVEVSSDLASVSSKLAYYGMLRAAARRWEQTLDDAYRTWRGKMTQHILAGDPKLAEWKVKAQIDNNREFRVFKENIRNAQELHERLQTAYEALREMASALRTLGGMSRVEYDNEDTHVRSEDRPPPSSFDEPERPPRRPKAKTVAETMNGRQNWRERHRKQKSSSER